MSEVPYSTTHVLQVLASHRSLTGRDLLAPLHGETDEATAARLYAAPLVVVAHDAADDPRFTYANLAAQELFAYGWDEFVGLPSRLSAEAPEREERERLLARVTAQGYIEDYSGIRIASSGRRFRILQATVWNVVDDAGRRTGQAAAFSDWTPAD